MRRSLLTMALLLFVLSVMAIVADAQVRKAAVTPSPSPTTNRTIPTTSPTPTPAKPQLSIDETVDYINKKLAEFSPYEYSGDHRLIRDSIKLSIDQRKIIETSLEYNKNTKQLERYFVGEAYVENLSESDFKAYNRDTYSIIYLNCTKEDKCVTNKGFSANNEPRDTDTYDFLSIGHSPDTQTRDRLLNAFKHLVKSLKEKIKRAGADPNDPFANPPKR